MSPKIGFVTCVHPFYELPEVAANRDSAIAALRAAGCDVVEATVPKTQLDTLYVAERLKEAGSDIVVLFFCTWVAEDITSALARELGDMPLFLWALPYLDRTIPMPSPMSGITATGSNLRNMGKRFAFRIGGITPENVEFVTRAARAGATVRALRGARFGLIGPACPGMLDVEADEGAVERALGSTVVHFPLEMALEYANAAPAEAVADSVGRLRSLTGGQEIGDAELHESMKLYVGLKRIVENQGLNGYNVRCWPEMRNNLRITPCAAHALLSEEGVANGCEVDSTALITTYVLSRLAGAPAFNFDVTAYLEDKGAIQVSHCGAAAPSLAGDKNATRIRNHMRTGTGATVEFQFKEGRATLAKLMRPSDGKLRLFVAETDVIHAGEDVRGSTATVRPLPSAAAFMDKFMREGVEHHISLVYGSWRQDLELFCEFTGVEYVPV